MISIAQGSALGFQQKGTNALKHQAQPLMGGDASRVGKRGSYYLVEFVFSSFLYPDAGRVAPISACDYLLCVSGNLKCPKNGLLLMPRHTRLSACLFCLDAKCGMRYCTQTFLGYEFARYTADAVGFVFNTHKGCLQCLDKLLLTCCHGG